MGVKLCINIIIFFNLPSVSMSSTIESVIFIELRALSVVIVYTCLLFISKSDKTS